MGKEAKKGLKKSTRLKKRLTETQKEFHRTHASNQSILDILATCKEIQKERRK